MENAIEASHGAQRTSKATLNPMLNCFHDSSQENKQGLDASLSKSLFYIAVMKGTKEGVTLLSDWP